MRKILFFLLVFFFFLFSFSHAYAQTTHDIVIRTDASTPILISGPDYATARLFVKSPDGVAFTVTGTWGIDFRTGDPASGGVATYFVDPSPSVFGTITIPADGSEVDVGAALGKTFQSQVVNNTGTCLTNEGRAFARARYTPGDTVNLTIRDPLATQITNIGAMMNLHINNNDGSPAAGASVTISPADSDPNGGRYTTDQFGQVLGAHRYNCSIRHTITASLGTQSKTITLFSSTDLIDPYICNGQSRTVNIPISSSPTATPATATPPSGATVTPTNPPPTLPPPPPALCGEKIEGSLDIPSNNVVACTNGVGSVTFSGNYRCKSGSCVNFEADPREGGTGAQQRVSYVSVDGTKYYFDSIGDSIGNDAFSKTIAMPPDNHQVYVHVEGYSLDLNSALFIDLYTNTISPNPACGSKTINLSCTAPLPAPTLSGSCSTNGTTLTYNWNSIAGASNYAIRVDENTSSWGGDTVYPGDTVNNNLPATPTTYTRSATQGLQYEAWIHAVDNRGVYSNDSNHVFFTCPGPTATPKF